MKNYLKTILLFAVFTAFAAAASAQARLTTVDGGVFNINDHKGKVVIMAVGASWIPLSAKQVEFTNVLSRKYAGKDVVVLYVATDSATQGSRNFASAADLNRFATTNKLAASMIRDSDGSFMLKQFALDQVPSFVILGKDGKMVGEPYGGIDPKYDVTVPISRVVDRLL